MNFELNEDEAMLKSLTERFVSDHYNHDSRRAFLAEPNGFSAANWALLGELGLIAAPFPEDCGGLALDATGIATVFEVLGHGLVVEPLAEAVVLAGRLFAMSASQALRDDWIDDLVSGQRRLALAHAESRAGTSTVWIETRARQDGNSWVLDGKKPYAIAGGNADGYIVSARISGEPSDESGIALFLVPAGTDGLMARNWTLADGSLACELTLESVLLPKEHQLDGGLQTIAAAEEFATLARSAEALGIMQRLFDETLDYLRTRDQFGAPLGSFQAIQHRMVDQYAVIEQCRSLLSLALVSWNTDRFAETVHGARAAIAEASVTLGHEMIQFHGGMGVTDELAVGGGHKRLLVLSRWPEGPQAALDRYASLLH